MKYDKEYLDNNLTDIELEEIARLIKEGYTSGRLDGDSVDEDEPTYNIAWSLTFEKWEVN